MVFRGMFSAPVDIDVVFGMFVADGNKNASVVCQFRCASRRL